MVWVTTLPECARGEHDKCKGSEGCDPGTFGGAACDCPCHDPPWCRVEFHLPENLSSEDLMRYFRGADWRQWQEDKRTFIARVLGVYERLGNRRVNET